MDLPLLNFNFRDQTRISHISRYWCPNWMKIAPIESPDSQLSIGERISRDTVDSSFLLLGHFSDSRRSEKWPKKAQKWPKRYQKWPKTHFWNSWIYIFCQHAQVRTDTNRGHAVAGRSPTGRWFLRTSIWNRISTILAGMGKIIWIYEFEFVNLNL